MKWQQVVLGVGWAVYFAVEAPAGTPWAPALALLSTGMFFAVAVPLWTEALMHKLDRE